MGDERWVVVNACDVFNNYREVACFYSSDDAFDYIDQHCDEDSHVEERFLPLRRVVIVGPRWWSTFQDGAVDEGLWVKRFLVSAAVRP